MRISSASCFTVHRQTGDFCGPRVDFWAFWRPLVNQRPSLNLSFSSFLLFAVIRANTQRLSGGIFAVGFDEGG